MWKERETTHQNHQTYCCCPDRRHVAGHWGVRALSTHGSTVKVQVLGRVAYLYDRLQRICVFRIPSLQIFLTGYVGVVIFLLDALCRLAYSSSFYF